MTVADVLSTSLDASIQAYAAGILGQPHAASTASCKRSWFSSPMYLCTEARSRQPPRRSADCQSAAFHASS